VSRLTPPSSPAVAPAVKVVQRGEPMTACRGSFAAPSGTVPGDDKVDPEQVEGPDLVSDSSLEVLPAII
jgi:hypothetical protein